MYFYETEVCGGCAGGRYLNDCSLEFGFCEEVTHEGKKVALSTPHARTPLYS